MTEAYLNGWHCHEKGLGSDANPHNELNEFYSHNQWVSGWCGRFEAIKHDKDLSLDMETGF